MADLTPYPFSALIRRMLRELEQGQAIFDLPARRFVTGDADLDTSVRFHGHRASSPLGPAAGPQTQMAQNLVLSWLGGCRVMELKTVQIIDDLDIPRPCIDVHTVGLNAEWSQELTLEQSLDEYVKGAMLIEMLKHSLVAPAQGFGDVVYDMSVGYDLAGIRSDRVLEFIHGMLDCSAIIERLRAEIPDEASWARDLDYPTRLSDTLTLSTFHGCPPGEIEGIIDFLIRELGLNSIVKFNPMLLGREEAHRLLYDVLGYRDMEVPDSAFERDTTWQQAVDLMGRLGDTAEAHGVGMGAKFSNTLIVRNTRGFLAPGEDEVYLSGQPLHVLAVNLVDRFRRTFGDRFPISFSAGIDRENYPDAVAIGLVPITVCTDLLRKGGYGRLQSYHSSLRARMESAGADTVDDFVLRAYGQAAAALDKSEALADEALRTRCLEALDGGSDLRSAAGEGPYAAWVSATKLLNTAHYTESATRNPRYARDHNDKPPVKIGSQLELFDCVTCDICVPVCPNDANFTFGSDQRQIPLVKAVRDGARWRWHHERDLELTRKHQIGNFVDFCNDCGNCDIFCPEDGGPYVMKPRFFGVEREWREATDLDGFFVRRHTDHDLVLGRFDGRESRLELRPGSAVYSGEGFELRFDPESPAESLEGEGPDEVDLTYCQIMEYLRTALLDTPQVNYVNTL